MLSSLTQVYNFRDTSGFSLLKNNLANITIEELLHVNNLSSTCLMTQNQIQYQEFGLYLKHATLNSAKFTFTKKKKAHLCQKLHPLKDPSAFTKHLSYKKIKLSQVSWLFLTLFLLLKSRLSYGALKCFRPTVLLF